MKPRKTYKIEREFMYSPLDGEPFAKWVQFYPFVYMQKSFADGAWSMLKSFYGGNKRFRLIDSDNNVVDEWNTGEVHVN